MSYPYIILHFLVQVCKQELMLKPLYTFISP